MMGLLVILILQSLKNENYGEFEAALDVVVKCIYNPPKYYAQVFSSSDFNLQYCIPVQISISLFIQRCYPHRSAHKNDYSYDQIKNNLLTSRAESL